MQQRVASAESVGRDAFDVALKMHEGRPPFWRPEGSLPTPLPIAVVMQSLAESQAAAMPATEAPRVIDIGAKNGSHSWGMDSQAHAEGPIPRHDIALAGVFGVPVSGRSVAGVRVTRSDTETLLSSIENRSDNGLTVFVMTADTAGKLDNEFRRALSVIGQKYVFCGLVDLHPSMIGPGSTQASRLIVIGRKRDADDFTFAVSTEVPVIYDYQALWGWSEALRAVEFGESHTFGDDGREENRWQAPYIPSSQVTEPVAMSPRNLLGPARKALAGIVERYQMGIDELVCEKLGWTMEQLESESRLDAEQADAVAIGIQAIDDGTGIVEADGTGMGKGRVAAALSLYAKRKGLPVLFLTEKADLFVDFYRDIKDIGALGEFSNPFIVNGDLVIRNDAGDVIARSPDKDEAVKVFSCGETPDKYDIVLSTYSQFNRKYDPINAHIHTRVARDIRALLNGDKEPFEVINDCREVLSTGHYMANNIFTAEDAIVYEAGLMAQALAVNDTNAAKFAQERIDLLKLDKSGLMDRLSSHIRTDMMTLKHQWLYSGALANSFVVADESHVAAGENSQTGVNLRHLVQKAASVAYSSATFAKDTNNFLLYSRLFPASLRSVTVGDTLARGGEPMQEILSAMLAADARLVRREHDLSNLTFKLMTDKDRAARNEEWANGFADVLSTLVHLSGEVSAIAEEKNSALASAHQLQVKAAKLAKGTNAEKKLPAVGIQYTNFSSKFYNLSRAFMMAINADLAADRAISALRVGAKPVITVENTMESVLRELVNGVELDQEEALDSQPQPGIDDSAEPVTKGRREKKPSTHELGRAVSFKTILKAYVDSMFSANEQVRSANKVLSSKRISLATPGLEELAQKAFEVIDAMPDVPLSPLDLVRERIEAAGFTVDEITGRRLRLVIAPDGTHNVVRMSERKKQPLKNAFNSGQLDALILSMAGSTGISLHASRTFADQSQRVLIELQIAADIAQRLQFWGRVNRKGQVCSPVIEMISSGLPGELRLISMQNAKLRRLSANISGNADNSAINDSAPDILNRIGNEISYRWIESNPGLAARMGLTIDDMTGGSSFGGTKYVDKLTSRVCMLNVDEQRQVYAEITEEFKSLVQQYELDGRNPLKSAEHDIRGRKDKAITMQTPTGTTSVFDGAVSAVELKYLTEIPGLDPQGLIAEADAGNQELTDAWGGDYVNKILDRCGKALEQALPKLLPKRFNTLEEAFADTNNNAVKIAAQRFEWVKKTLHNAIPGSIFGMYRHDDHLGNDSIDTTGSRGSFNDDLVFVTSVDIPSNPLSFAGYKISGYRLDTRKKFEISLSSLSERGVYPVTSRIKDNKTRYNKYLEDHLFKSHLPTKRHDSRIVLEGNLFRAAEIADAMNQGSAITYSDEKGIWHHAILMPRTTTMRNVRDFPVIVDSPETIKAALFDMGKERTYAVISDDFRKGQNITHTYRLRLNENGIRLEFQGVLPEKCAWLTENKDILACTVNGINGTRTNRDCKIAAGMEDKFIEAFMTAANANGKKVLLEGYMRDWYNNYLNMKTGFKDDSLSAALDAAANEDNDEEIAGLLAAPAM
ncbi:hypothetical protein CBP35_19755 (plasmid) [Acidovorax carolinensis]|nr:hypothetical protein CBP35_19755 [Acidovorax carolinensis]